MAKHIARAAPNLDGHLLLVCDTTDSVGGPIASAIAEHAGLTEEMKRHAEKLTKKGDDAQTMIAVVPIAAMAAMIEDSNPDVTAALHGILPDDAIFIVVIAAGGTSLLATRRPVASPPTAPN